MPRKPKAVTQLNTYYNNCVLMGDVLEDDSILVDCFRMKKIKGLWTLVSYYEEGGSIDLMHNGTRNPSKNIDSLDVPDYVEVIGDRAFYNGNFCCVNISRNVREICPNAFSNCQFLTEVIIKNNNLKVIPDSAFSGCRLLNKINIPKGVKEIGFAAFLGCVNLESVTLPEGLKCIGSQAFECCDIENIEIPSTVSKIGSRAFARCINLKEVVIKCNSLRHIPYGMFHGCNKLENINIPEGVEDIGATTFFECSSLKSIRLPDSVRQIYSMAFESCSSLESIRIPEAVREITARAFSRCYSLKEVRIPRKLQRIGGDGSYGCRSLDIKELPKSVTEIESGAFCGTAITEITILAKYFNLASAFDSNVKIYCPNYTGGYISPIKQICNKSEAVKQYMRVENEMRKFLP